MNSKTSDTAVCSTGKTLVFDAEGYDLAKTFDCGQCFRFEPVADTIYACEFGGVAYGQYIRFADDGSGHIIVIGAKDGDGDFWRHYLALDIDYGEIRRQILRDFNGSKTMERAIEVAGGIHILAQERFETLCSFILSQNNNIPRIKKLISALCENYGSRIDACGKVAYAFPTPVQLSRASEKDLAGLRMGFRARYIADAVSRTLDGRLSLDTLTAENARQALLSVCGVGEKVAACTRLFGIGDLSAFPVDVWIKRIIADGFDGQLDVNNTGKYGGVAQQYLFYYIRYAEAKKQ